MDWKTSLDNAFSDVLSRRNLFVLVLFWLAGSGLLVVYGTFTGRWMRFGPLASFARPQVPDNQTGAFAVWRKSSRPDGRPAYRIAFDNLRAENGHLGPVRTALKKNVHIDNLQVRFTYSPADRTVDDPGGDAMSGFCQLFKPYRQQGRAGSLLGLFQELQEDMAGWSVSMDLSNTTQVQIRHLDWQVLQGEDAVLIAQCMHASLQVGSPYIVLRGRARVSVKGSTLESNCIRLDVERERLIVDGRYMLTRDGSRHIGTGARFDTALAPLSDRS